MTPETPAAVPQVEATGVVAEPASSEIVGVWTVIVVAVLPAVLLGLNYILQYDVDRDVLIYLNLLGRGIADITLILGIAWLIGLSRKQLGIAKPNLADLAVAVLIAAAWSAVSWWSREFAPLPDSFGWTPPAGVMSGLFAATASVAAALGEELIYRAFLIGRLQRILSSTGLAVILSSLLFAITHLYQGHAAVVLHFGVSIVIGSLYVVYPRVLAFGLGHGLCNVLLDYRVFESTPVGVTTTATW